MPGELTVTSTVNCLSNFQKIGPYLKHFLIGKQCCRVLHRTFKCSKVIFTLAFFSLLWAQSLVRLLKCEYCFQTLEVSRALIPVPFENIGLEFASATPQHGPHQM